MIRLKPNVQKGEHFFPYVKPTDFGGEDLQVSAVQSVTWSIYETDETAVVEDQAIGSADSDGRWVANVTPTYTTYTESYNKEFIIIFTVTFAATIGGTAYTNLTAKVKARFTIEHIPS